jgi:hypothetical protein
LGRFWEKVLGSVAIADHAGTLVTAKIAKKDRQGRKEGRILSFPLRIALRTLRLDAFCLKP